LQTPVIEKAIVIEGLIGETDFLKEFETYSEEAMKIEDNPKIGLLSPTLEESKISSELKELDSLYSSVKKDVRGLNQCVNLLNKKTRHYIRLLRRKAKAVKDEFNAKIKAQEGVINPKISSLQNECDKQIIKSTKSFEKQRLPTQKRKVKLEKTLQRALAKIEKCKLEAKTCAEKDNAVGEEKWKEKATQTKKELSKIEDDLRKTEKALKDLEERKSLEIFNVRSELETKIKELRQPLIDLESSRDAKLLIFKQEIQKLEQQTKLILDQIGRAIKFGENSLEEFIKLGFKQEIGKNNKVVFYVPFYVICYKTESKKRYLLLPPSKANSIGLFTKLKGAFGRARIRKLLVRRFEFITSLMDNINVLAQQNAVFESKMRELGERTDILKMDSLRKSIMGGLDSINKEGWLSEKEHQILQQEIAQE